MIIDDTPIYEGKSKSLYKITTSENKLLMRFKDDVTAFNNKKHDIINGKGTLNNFICSRILEYLEDKFIDTHFVVRVSDTDMIVKKLNMLPVEVVVRNNIYGGLVKRLGLDDRIGERIFNKNENKDSFIMELFYKDDNLGDPLINEDHAIILGLLTYKQLHAIKRIARDVNFWLMKYFNDIGIDLADFKLEFGLDNKDNIILADDICPDGCRLIDKYSGDSLDKDNYRYDKNDLYSSYYEVYNRIVSIYDKNMSLGDYLYDKIHIMLKSIYLDFINNSGEYDEWDVEHIDLMNNISRRTNNYRMYTPVDIPSITISFEDNTLNINYIKDFIVVTNKDALKFSKVVK